MTEPSKTVSRRKLFAGASALGAVAATASLVPGIKTEVSDAVVVKAPPAKGGGYTLSEHVKQYYKTTLI